MKTLLQPGARLLAGLNLEQQQAVTAEGDLQVLAGAGTGKTEVLARRYVWLWQQLNKPPVTGQISEEPWTDIIQEPRILVLTFTDQSARAMKARIETQLGDWLGRPISVEGWIGTFHSQCQRLLPKPLPVLDSLKQHQLLDDMLTRLLNGAVPALNSALNDWGLETAVSAEVLSVDSLSQLPVLEIVPLLRSLPYLVQTLQACGLSPSGFYDIARRQTLSWRDQLVSLPVGHPLTGESFDSAPEAIAAWQAHLADWASSGWEPISPLSPDGLTDSDYFKPVACLKDALLRYDRKTKRYRTLDAADGEAMRNLHSATELEMALIPVVTAFYAWYRHRLATEAVTDYDGQIQGVLDHWEASPDALDSARAQFAAVMVDEFQDSNPAQCALLRQLRPQLGLTVVGDVKQSIYSFRFATPENLDRVFAEPPAQVALFRNYRSHPDILATANQLTRQIWADAHPPLESGLPPEIYKHGQRIPSAQQVSIAHVLPLTDETLSLEPKMHTQNRRAIQDQRNDEAQWIAARFNQLHDDGAYGWSDMTVLCQNHRRAMAVHDALWQASIPACLLKQPTLFEQPAVQDAMALLRLLIGLSLQPTLSPSLPDPLAPSWIRVLQHKLPDATLVRLANAAHRQTWAALLHQLPAGLVDPFLGQTLAALVKGLMQLAESLRRSGALRSVFEEAAGAMELFEVYHFYPLQLNAIALWQGLLDYAGQSAGSLGEILDSMDLWEQHPYWMPEVTDGLDPDAVRVMTCHSAKGLEFPVVAVAWVEPDRVRTTESHLLCMDPQYEGRPGFGLMLNQWDSEETLKKQVYQLIWKKPRAEAEQKRLFYVALTRARDHLFLLRSSQSAPWTDVLPEEPEAL